MAGIKRTKWTEDPPEWEEQYRDVDEEPTYTPSDPSWTEDNNKHMTPLNKLLHRKDTAATDQIVNC